METQTLDPKTKLLQELNGYKELDFNVTIDENTLQETIERELSLADLTSKLYNVKQDKIKIKEVILESELDFINSVTQLKKVYNEEFNKMVSKVKDLYKNEITQLRQLFRKALIGEQLIEMVNRISSLKWCLIIKNKSVNLYKYYDPVFPVYEGYYESGEVRIYDEPICYLKGIYVNILHPAITVGTIYLSTEGKQHPNCQERNFGGACPGDLQDRELPVADIDALITLLTEISSTYERMHLDSAYYIPTTNYTTRKENKETWTT